MQARNPADSPALLLQSAITRRLLADPTPLLIAGCTDILSWIETCNAHDYWAVRWTALLDQRPTRAERSDADIDERLIRLHPAPTFGVGLAATERAEFFRRLALREGRSKREALKVAQIALAADEVFFARHMEQSAPNTFK